MTSVSYIYIKVCTFGTTNIVSELSPLVFRVFTIAAIDNIKGKDIYALDTTEGNRM